MIARKQGTPVGPAPTAKPQPAAPVAEEPEADVREVTCPSCGAHVSIAETSDDGP